jgi:hypothetical protein
MCDKKLPTIIKGATGYISSYNIKRRLSRFGHRSCSYILEASPGQRWNLTLFDFGMRYNVLREPGRVHLGSIRHKYATVQETGSPPSDSRFIIGGEDREKSVYLSQKHRVFLEVYDTANEADARHFLIQYKGECHFHAVYRFLLILLVLCLVVGCADPHIQGVHLMKREGDVAFMKCNSSGEKWELRCEGHSWVGAPPHTTNCAVGMFKSYSYPEAVQLKPSHNLHIDNRIVFRILYKKAVFYYWDNF